MAERLLAVALDAQALDAPANQDGCISGVVLSYARRSDDACKVICSFLCSRREG
jgi:hypothetical protein